MIYHVLTWIRTLNGKRYEPGSLTQRHPANYCSAEGRKHHTLYQNIVAD
jgi:hypothetical protein